MKNSVFRSITTEEKQKHLSSVLKRVTRGTIDESMVEPILFTVSPHSQYTIFIYRDDSLFREAVARAKTGDTVLSYVVAAHNL